MARRGKERTEQLRILSQSVFLEEARTPYMVRGTMLVICLAFIAFIAWASVTTIEELARTTGEIVPSTYVQTVQHLDGGVVAAIEVREDEPVRKGQVLIRLRGDDVRHEYKRVETRFIALQIQKARLEAYLEGDDSRVDALAARYPDLVRSQKLILEGMLASLAQQEKVLREQIAQKERELAALQQELANGKKSLAIARTAFATQEKLYRERLVSETAYLAAKRELNEQRGRLETLAIRIQQAKATIEEYEGRLASQVAQNRAQILERLGALETEYEETKTLLDKLAARIDRLDIRSPVDGVVKGLTVHTIGGVITPGQKILEVVPTGTEVIAEVKISPNDIGHVAVGSQAIVKVTSYDFSRYGALTGTVTAISATTFSNQRGQTYYKGIVKLAKNYLGNDPSRNLVLPGMIVNADIVTGEKTLMAYFLKPIHKALSSSFRER